MLTQRVDRDRLPRLPHQWEEGGGEPCGTAEVAAVPVELGNVCVKREVDEGVQGVAVERARVRLICW